ncbi:MAG TPA: S8 family serine peptidase, partial [Candidatus Saccharimonadia bacterium]|nr:S8 family serine peptidase [Candidatus Saccharimonadia bacterium]
AVGGAGAYRRPAGYGGPVALEGVLDRIAREHALRRVDGWTMRALEVWCEVFEARDGAARERALVALARDPRVESAQPMQRFEAQAMRPDPYRDLQPAALSGELAAAHRVARGRGIRIAVIDSGVDATHADLRGALERGRDFVGGGERGTHGTGVAGVIGARADNGVGITGVAPEARLSDLRACWDEGGHTACNSYTLARALDAALAARPGVINLSLAGPEDPLLARLLAVAETRGIVVVAAVPPGFAVAQAFPAGLASVLAVVEHERDEPGAVRAPGKDVLTTLPGDRYDFASGSSIAAAHVSGAAALYRETVPDASPARVRAALRAWPERTLAQVLQCGRDSALAACAR